MTSESLLSLPLFSRNQYYSKLPHSCIWSSWQTLITLSLLVQHLITIIWTAFKTARRLTFAVGPRELREFRMIERHYFRDQVNQLTLPLCNILSLIPQNGQNNLLINYAHLFLNTFSSWSRVLTLVLGSVYPDQSTPGMRYTVYQLWVKN